MGGHIKIRSLREKICRQKSLTNFSDKFGKIRANILRTPKNLSAATPVSANKMEEIMSQVTAHVPLEKLLGQQRMWHETYFSKAKETNVMDTVDEFQQRALLSSLIPCCKSAVPKLFECRAKFAIMSASAGRTTLCIEKKQHVHHHSRLYTGTAIYFICSETNLQCDLRN